MIAASKSLGEKYREAIEDPQLGEFRADIALLEARVDELLQACESELLWAKAQTAFGRHLKAVRSKNDEAVRASLAELHDLLTRGYQDSLRWAEIYDVIEQAGQAKERELKRLVALRQLISVEETYEQMSTFTGWIVDILTSTVKDRAVLKEVINKIGATVHKAGLSTDGGSSTDVDDDGAEPRADADDQRRAKRMCECGDEEKVYFSQAEIAAGKSTPNVICDECGRPKLRVAVCRLPA